MRKNSFVSRVAILATLFILFIGTSVSAAAKSSYEEKVVYFDYYTNSIGNTEYYGIVEIKNTGNTNLYLKSCTFDLEDNSGHLLQSDSFISTCRSVIAPGEKGYFYNSIGSCQIDKGVDGSKGIKLVPDVTIKEATGKPNIYAVTDTSIKQGTFGYPSISGRIVNDTGKDVSYMYVNFILYDKNGNVIGISGTSVTNVKAGKNSSFDGTLMLNNKLTMDNIAKYEVVAEDTYYQW